MPNTTMGSVLLCVALLVGGGDAARRHRNYIWGQNGDDTFMSISDIVLQQDGPQDQTEDYALNGNNNYFAGGCGDDRAIFDGST